LGKHHNRDLVVILAPVGKADKEQVVCGICGFALNEAGECPRCKLQNEEIAKGLRKRQSREAFLREVDELVKEKWEDADEAESAS
jgi:hypothetical protein